MTGERFAVWAIDPGGTTGYAKGTFEARSTLAETLSAAVDGSELFAGEVGGDTVEQSLFLADEFATWARAVRRDGFAVHLVFEDFQLRTALADLSPVEVAHGVRVLLHGLGGYREAVQSPGDAKRFATSERLRGWGLFALGRGSDHKRDALRHMALRVNRVLG